MDLLSHFGSLVLASTLLPPARTQNPKTLPPFVGRRHQTNAHEARKPINEASNKHPRKRGAVARLQGRSHLAPVLAQSAEISVKQREGKEGEREKGIRQRKKAIEHTRQIGELSAGSACSAAPGLTTHEDGPDVYSLFP